MAGLVTSREMRFRKFPAKDRMTNCMKTNVKESKYVSFYSFFLLKNAFHFT